MTPHARLLSSCCTARLLSDAYKVAGGEPGFTFWQARHDPGAGDNQVASCAKGTEAHTSFRVTSHADRKTESFHVKQCSLPRVIRKRDTGVIGPHRVAGMSPRKKKNIYIYMYTQI